jgi:hypothetical protein
MPPPFLETTTAQCDASFCHRLFGFRREPNVDFFCESFTLEIAAQSEVGDG